MGVTLKAMPLFSSETDRRYAMLGMRIVGDFGAAIAVPVVVFVLIGQWLDGKYGTGFKFTISAFVLAALVSGKILYKKAKAYGSEFQSLNDVADKKTRLRQGYGEVKKNNEKNPSSAKATAGKKEKN